MEAVFVITHLVMSACIAAILQPPFSSIINKCYKTIVPVVLWTTSPLRNLHPAWAIFKRTAMAIFTLFL